MRARVCLISRNRLKVYKGLHLASIRKFAEAANLFLDTVSTFTCIELMSFADFVALTVLLSVFALPRTELNQKVRACVRACARVCVYVCVLRVLSITIVANHWLTWSFFFFSFLSFFVTRVCMCGALMLVVAVHDADGHRW